MHSGCYNKNTKCWVACKNLFFTVLKAGRSKIKAWVGLVSGEEPVPDSQMATSSLCLHMVEEARVLSDLFYKGINCTHEGGCHRYDLVTSQRPLPPNTIALGIRFQCMNFGWGNTNIQSVEAALNCYLKPSIVSIS